MTFGGARRLEGTGLQPACCALAVGLDWLIV